MAGVKLWSGVAVAIQSALVTTIPITACTKANPGVITYTGTDPVNGDYLLISSVVGMYQLQERVIRLANVSGGGNTAELEGVDTTSFNTWATGNGNVVTFGTNLQSAVGITVTGGEFEFVDKTTIHDFIRSRIPSVASPISLQFQCAWDPSDSALVAFKAASDIKAQRSVKITFQDGAVFAFYGYVGFAFIPTGNAQEMVTCQVSIEGSGRPTAYAI